MNDFLESEEEQDDSRPRAPLSFAQRLAAGAGSVASGVPTEDEESVQPRSIGARIAAGGGSAAPVTPAASPEAPLPAESVLPKNPPRAIIPQSTPEGVPSPQPSIDATLRPLMQRRSEMLSGDITEKEPKYRMGVGSRIAAALADFGMGFGRTGGEPIYFGRGAANARYGRDLTQVNQQIADEEKLGGMNTKLYEDAIKQAYEGQLGEAKTSAADSAAERAKAYGELADVKGQLAQSTIDLNEAKANKANEPKAPTSEFSGWYEAFTRDNGRPPSAKEIAQHDIEKARAGKDTSAADAQKAIQVSEYKGRQLEALEREKDVERQKERARIDKDFIGGTGMPGAKRDAAYQKLENDLNQRFAPRVQQISDEADKMLGLTKAGTKLKSQPAAPNKPAQPSPRKLNKQDYPVGSTVNVDGKPRKVVGWNDKTNKPIVN